MELSAGSDLLTGSGTLIQQARTATWQGSGAGAPPTTFTMPPRLQATFSSNSSGVTADIGPLPSSYDTVLLRSNDSAGFQSLEATANWLAIHGDATVEFDTSAPGYDPSWVVTQHSASTDPISVDVDYTQNDPANGMQYEGSVFQTTDNM